MFFSVFDLLEVQLKGITTGIWYSQANTNTPADLTTVLLLFLSLQVHIFEQLSSTLLQSKDEHIQRPHHGVRK